MYETILFPTDGSPGAERARDHALELATDQDATLHVLNVVEAFSPAASLAEMISEHMTEEGTALVDSVAALARERGIRVETAVIEGDPAETIVEYAARTGADTIVMPTHGRPELTKAIVGSVTDKVIRNAHVPVVVVRFTE